MKEVETKQCEHCGKEMKKYYYFGVHSKAKRERKFCSINCRNTTWRKKNPTKFKESVKNWVKNNPSKVKKYRRNWRENNPVKWREINLVWGKNNPEKVREYKRKWKQEWYKNISEENYMKHLKASREWAKNNRDKVNSRAKRARNKLKKNKPGVYREKRILERRYKTRCPIKIVSILTAHIILAKRITREIDYGKLTRTDVKEKLKLINQGETHEAYQ